MPITATTDHPVDSTGYEIEIFVCFNSVLEYTPPCATGRSCAWQANGINPPSDAFAIGAAVAQVGTDTVLVSAPDAINVVWQ